MYAASATLIVAALLNACVWLGLLRQLWVLRHSFEIAARAPVLVGICSAASLTVLSAILVHWILLLEAKGLPCYVMLLVSYFCECISLFLFGERSAFSCHESSRTYAISS